MLKLNYFLADIFILSAEKQPIKLSWRKIEWLRDMPMMNFIPCDGTDGCVPFVLPPRCPASAMQPAGIVGNGRRDGTARAPRCKRKKVKTLSPTLGIAGESPQHSEDLQRKARPEGERPNTYSGAYPFTFRQLIRV